MRLLSLLVIFIASMCGPRAAFADDIDIIGADGRQLSVIASFPSGDGKFPAIILAPGQGYHMNLPVMEEAARSFIGQGTAVFRFNWSYFTAQPRGKPSEDLSKELQDFQAVLAAARNHPRVAGDKLVVGGKSLGSLVAWRALSADPKLRGALLLTPVCSRVPNGESQPRPEANENYPGLDTQERPSLWISGDRDPLCSAQVLYTFASSSRRARVAIVGGDHGFENRALQPAGAETVRKRNIAAVSVLAAAFVSDAVNALP